PVLVEQYHDAARKLLAELIDRKAQHPDAYKKVFFAPGDGKPVARQIVERFATRAFRRPADPAFLDRLLGLYDKARAKGQDHQTALPPVLTDVLVSAAFLRRL